jgi:hypothetical protein
VTPKNGLFSVDENEEATFTLSQLLPNQQYFLKVEMHIRDVEADKVGGTPMVARFFLKQYTKTVKIYQIITTLLNYRKIYQMAVKYVFLMTINYTNIFHSEALQNVPKLGFFGLKIYHLATLLSSMTTLIISCFLFT